MKKLLLLIAISLFLTACGPKERIDKSSFEYPASKVWYHCADEVWIVQEKEPFFDGIEVDVNYNDTLDELYIGHELITPAHSTTLAAWFAAMQNPSSKCFWIDLKNLTVDNAMQIADILIAEADRYGIRHRMIVESSKLYALKRLKRRGLHVSLWVDNIYYTGESEEEWRKATQQQIEELHPDALSCEYRMFPLLPQSFPDQNIHFWDTPREYNDTNVAHTRMLLRDPAVKVVLVDYPKPIDY